MSYSESYRRIIHKMGYYTYQSGLVFHHMDEEGGWNTHLQNCRNFILKAVEIINPSVISVLGSGWLLDLPLKELYETSNQINLVDIIHPPEVKTQVEKMNRVILREDDVTGGLIQEVWDKTSGRTFLNKLKSIKEIEIKEYKPDFEPGLVISLNILTQLEALPLTLVRKRSKAGEEELYEFRKTIQGNHLAFLRKHRSVLITDLSEIITDRKGNAIEERSVLVPLPQGNYYKEWIWNFEQKRSDYYNRKSVFKVAGIIF